MERKKKNALWKYSHTSNEKKKTTWTLEIYQRYHIVIWILQSTLKRFSIFFFTSFNSQCVDTPIINEWTGIAVLSCPGKYSSYIPTSIVLGKAVMGKYQ